MKLLLYFLFLLVKLAAAKSGQTETVVQTLNFIVVGDTGKTSKAQTKVANAMSQWADTNAANFIVNVGDNFYPDGVTHQEDPQWENSWRNIYNQPSLNVSWYSILGNHDYHQNASAQVAYHYNQEKDPRWYMPDVNYTFTKTIAPTNQSNGTNITIKFIMIDTTPLAYENSDKFYEPHDEVQRTGAYNWIEEQLALSKSYDYIFVCGHHPIFSAADHGPNNLLIHRLLPLLQKYNVAIYFSGHDHYLEHVIPMRLEDPVDHVVSGSGSKRGKNPDVHAGIVSNFGFHISDTIEENGFVTVSIHKNTSFEVNFWNTKNEVVHSFTKLHVSLPRVPFTEIYKTWYYFLLLIVLGTALCIMAILIIHFVRSTPAESNNLGNEPSIEEAAHLAAFDHDYENEDDDSDNDDDEFQL